MESQHEQERGEKMDAEADGGWDGPEVIDERDSGEEEGASGKEEWKGLARGYAQDDESG